MIISFIAAVSENNAIGIGGNLPWSLPADMRFFKKTTLGKPVVMGRKTYESLGKPLPGRLNIVLSQDNTLQLPDGVLLFHHLNEAIGYLQNTGTEEAFIIGGGKIFEAALPLADRLYITRVHTVVTGADAFFPEIDHTHWKVVWHEDHQPDANHKFGFSFQEFRHVDL